METRQLSSVDSKGPCKVALLKCPLEAQCQVWSEASEWCGVQRRAISGCRLCVTKWWHFSLRPLMFSPPWWLCIWVMVRLLGDSWLGFPSQEFVCVFGPKLSGKDKTRPQSFVIPWGLKRLRGKNIPLACLPSSMLSISFPDGEQRVGGCSSWLISFFIFLLPKGSLNSCYACGKDQNLPILPNTWAGDLCQPQLIIIPYWVM